MQSSLGVAALVVFAIGVSAVTNNAVVRMYGTTNAPNANGLIQFAERADGQYDITFSGWAANAFAPNSVHGFHIHEFGDLSGLDANRVGGHFNPFGQPHGCPGGDARHVGDMGNITADATGSLNSVTLVRGGFNLTFDATQAGAANSNVVGRGVIIHNAPDDCRAVTSAGVRLSQGTIGSAQGTSGVGSTYAATALSARLTDNLGNRLGWAWMREDPTNASLVEVLVTASGLVPGSTHGIHIHQFGDHSNLDATTAGAHWNPDAANVHRLPYEGENRHMGDLGNVIADTQGKVYHRKSYLPIVLGGGAATANGQAWNVIGRGFVLHALPDQGTVAPGTGNAGSRLGMGVLGIANATLYPDVGAPALLSAYAKLVGTSKLPDASGWVRVTHGADNMAVIEVSLSGLPAPGGAGVSLAMHIHEFGDVTGHDGMTTGGHYNPWGVPHACFPATATRHVGDIGNLPVSNADGTLTATLRRDLIALTGQNSTVGRAIIVHAMADNCETQPTGGAGDRYLQGVLGIVSAAGQSATNPGVHPARPITTLVAVVTPTNVVAGTQARGVVFARTHPTVATRTQIFVNLTGVAPVSADHGLHVHTFGDWSLPSGASAGAHWNPDGYTHALPSQADRRHAGDLGNVQVDANGNVQQLIEIDLGILQMRDMIGRGIVLHQDHDQGTADPDTGRSGNRLALGVFGVTNQAWPDFTPSVIYSSSSTAGTCNGVLTADGQCTNAAAHAAPSAAVAALSLAAALLVAVRLH